MNIDEILETADARIREHRTADAEIVVRISNPSRLRNATLTIEQTRHEFLFGCNIFAMDSFGSED